ncbi:pectate lyase, PelA/Pel-15E family [Paenibacillus polysaccharolyticus]|uniref:Pectate lyase, PelA/Pel-15E family n=2 Tax=Paenibacillus TaxID=44249 RepID=A0A1G5L8W1_9BACL|nr:MULTISPECIES: pectate lyase [Paenibacillus]MDP9698654.1 PelA/Pel-15E family pectate lyase [Paenibacillus intestini]SCZ09302.1 pectate lyase, PelA/Pel-15E family [Paenibacillus polysaccharolyticus]
MKAKKLVTFVLACSMVFSVAGMAILPVPTVSAADASGTTASMSDILKNQRPDGGWRKDYSQTSGEWAKSTIDNKATYSEIRRLASEFKKTNDPRYSAAAVKGINFLLNMQYSNGGWPQVYQSSGYHKHITYNDDAMINVMYMLDEVAGRKGNFSFIDSSLANRSKNAVSKGVDAILNTQVVSGGKLTAWGQQHDSSSLRPAGARIYEVPSLTAGESVNIVKFLKTRPANSRITASIKGAEAWFNKVKITGYRYERANGDSRIIADSSASPIWARFYELGTDKPIFVGRDGVVKYKLSDIEKERRGGYAWYGNWPSKL